MAKVNPERFARLGGTASRYLDTQTGETVSYRQARKQSGAPLPAKPLKGKPRYRQMLRDYQREVERKEGRVINLVEAKQAPDLKQAIKNIARINRNRLARSKRAMRAVPYTEAEARTLVEALEAMGRRPRDWQFYIGGE